MSRPWIATQLFVGRRELRELGVEGIERSIRDAREIAGVDALAIWPCEDPALLEKLSLTARQCGIQPYLWFPLLADPPGRKVLPGELVQLFDGGRGHGKSGAWEGLRGGQEDFLFACPNNPEYLEEALRVFQGLVERMQPAGVMLDRIRFPSPANGFEALFSCFCPRCRARFEAETGRPLSLMRDYARLFFGAIVTLHVAGLSSKWRSADAVWSSAGLGELAAFRARSICSAAGRLAEKARALGLKVGLDLFSPSLAGLVGQDYKALAGICDWMKPMTYCRAVGPAGLPLEISCLRRALRVLCPGRKEEGPSGILSALLGWELPPTEQELLDRGLPVNIIASELESLRGLGLPPEVGIHAGIEAVRNPEFRIDVTAEILEASLAQARGRCQGIVASWNVLYIPKDNLARLGAIEA